MRHGLLAYFFIAAISMNQALANSVNSTNFNKAAKQASATKQTKAAKQTKAKKSTKQTKRVRPHKDLTWVVSVSGGVIWANAGETQDLYLNPGIEKRYVADKPSQALGSGELFVGLQKKLSSAWLSQFGLEVATMGNATAQGVIWDDAEPQFENYSYQYRVNSTRAGIKGKLLHINRRGFMPWVSAGLGIGFNKAHSFTNTPLIFEAVPNANFTDKTITTFAYNLGFGLQKLINTHWQVGVSYEFADWGGSELGLAQGQTMDTGLKLNHLYTNGVLLNVTYVA